MRRENAIRPNGLDKSRKLKMERVVPLLLSWFAHNARDLPWRRTTDPYAIWVSEIMLQQTQVKTVMPYWERWMRALPTIERLAKARSPTIHKLWEGLGYYTRVRNLHKAARFILKEHGGKFPERFDQVLALPGVGRYTAGAVCSIAFNQPTPVLDGNVIRVLTRLFGIADNPRERPINALLWELARALVKRAMPSASHLNQSLMELGALICTPQQPNCTLCPLVRDCEAFRHHQIERLPNLTRKNGSTARRYAAFVVERDGRFLVRQRPEGVVNAHLWEFLNTEVDRKGEPEVKAAARKLLGFMPRTMRPMGRIKHSITRYRITVEVYGVKAAKDFSHLLPNGRWLRRRELRRLTFPSAHKQILARLDELPL